MLNVLQLNACSTHQVSRRQSISTDPVQYGTGRHSQSLHGAFDDCLSSADRKILDQVKQALHECGIDTLRRVRAYCEDGRITLQGRVPSYYIKQVAQEVIRNVAKVRDIDNDLQVLSH